MEMSSEKTIASGLFELYAAQQSELRDYFHSAQVFLTHLKNALREALGFPEAFQDMQGRAQPWAKLYTWDSDSGDVQAVDTGFDVDTMNEQGELEAAIGITLAHSENSFPKSVYYVAVRIKPTRDAFHVAIGPDRDKSFTFARDASDFPAFYDAFVEILEATLKRSPFDQGSGVFAPQRGIGFVLGS